MKKFFFALLVLTIVIAGCPQPPACKGEGEFIPVIENPPECCSGLELLPPNDTSILGIHGYCTAKCGNGECDSAIEGVSNCPEDCSNIFACAEEGEIVVEGIEGIAGECCPGLKKIPNFGDKLSVAGTCYSTGIPVPQSYLCIECGDGICRDYEDICYCPEDCSGASGSYVETVEEFCSFYWAIIAPHCYNNPSMPICGLCSGLLPECAEENQEFSKVYVGQYPPECCFGLTAWESGMDTRISIAGTCYETGLESGSPVGTCIACGDGNCSGSEDVCNCPADCSGSKDSKLATIEEFCADQWVAVSGIMCNEGSELEICGLCE
ncbi:MAG: hypothetical protein JW772_05710 [Candidatus Diapherotrites archaeon]|nr:hypothetical protein [Candidatus Diapherotrites archaeon]